MSAERVDAGKEPKSGMQIRSLRWYICGLLVLGITVNYIDRQVFSILAPDLQKEIGWSELEYGRIVIAFQVAYAVMMAISGRIIDRIGNRLGLTIAMIWWSLAEVGHAFARNPLQFAIARFLLGAGEAASFPASIRAIGEWFPKSERALATGIVNAATTSGAVLAPVVVPLFVAVYGWKGAFIGTGAIGALWLVGWLGLYDRPESHRWLTRQERHFILGSGREEETTKVQWLGLLRYRQLWAYSLGRVLTDPVYWFVLYWLPKYLAQDHGIRGAAATAYLATVYACTGVGSVIGGYCSSTLMKRGWGVNWARKTTMGVLSAFTPFVILAGSTRNVWTAVLLIGLVMAAHQGWSSNNFTLILDLFPKRAVGAVFGFGGFLGVSASVATAELTGRVLQNDPHNYLPMFVYSGCAYLVANVVIHLLVPRLEPADVK